MPCKARIDAPGALHHIIVRGIERRKIFKDDTDRINFLDRLGVDLAPKLNISQPAVSMSAQRGERIASENGYSLMDEWKLINLGASCKFTEPKI